MHMSEKIQNQLPEGVGNREMTPAQKLKIFLANLENAQKSNLGPEHAPLKEGAINNALARIAELKKEYPVLNN